MRHDALARTAKVHALRAAGSSWAASTAVLATAMAFVYPWFDFFLPVDGLAVIPPAMIVAGAIVVFLPLERIGDAIVDELVAGDAAGRLRNVAEEVAVAIGERSGQVVIHESEIPNVGAFPTRDGIVVMATTRAVEQLRRDELEALVAAQFAGMRDRWCRLATRAELVWKYTMVLGVVSIVFALPVPVFVGGVMFFLPRSIEATRDLCADVAAVTATRHPAALANGLRNLVPAASVGNRQRLVRRWYLPISAFLVLPKRVQSTTTVTVGNRPKRTYYRGRRGRVRTRVASRSGRGARRWRRPPRVHRPRVSQAVEPTRRRHPSGMTTPSTSGVARRVQWSWRRATTAAAAKWARPTGTRMNTRSRLSAASATNSTTVTARVTTANVCSHRGTHVERPAITAAAGPMPSTNAVMTQSIVLPANPNALASVRTSSPPAWAGAITTTNVIINTRNTGIAPGGRRTGEP